MLKNGKSENRNEYQNRKTEVFWHKDRKTDLKSGQTAKPKIPMPPSVKNLLDAQTIADSLLHALQEWGFNISGLVGDEISSSSSGDAKRHASAYSRLLQDSEFIVALTVSQFVLSFLAQVTKSLQAKSCNLGDAYKSITLAK